MQWYEHNQLEFNYRRMSNTINLAGELMKFMIILLKPGEDTGQVEKNVITAMT